MSNTSSNVRAGSLATLIATMATLFIAYFVIALAAPVLPLNVHEALASVPSLPLSPSLVICDSQGGKSR